MPILVGTDGVRRMGKSLGNYIGVADGPDEQFGKVMSVPDEPMRQYFTLLTDLPIVEIDTLLASDVNPRDAKEALGKAIVSQYHGMAAAEHSASAFRRRAAGEDPDDIRDIALPAELLDAECRVPAPILIKELKLDTSTTKARKVIEQGGFNVGPERETISDPRALIYVSDGLIIRYGKRNIARIRLV
jgi:tyrosyl-tRNA synthetase